MSTRFTRLIRSSARLVLATSAGALATFGGRPAQAQLGAANTPLPNVLILLDTSGSFEHMIDGSNPEDPANNPIVSNGTNLYAQCLAGAGQFGNPNPPGGWTPQQGTIPNKWGTAVQALTGSITPAYNCYPMSRNSPATISGFTDQYSITVSGQPQELPYDYGYYLPFHRPLSYDASTGNYCAFTPGILPGDPGGSFGISPTVAGAAGNATDFPAGSVAQQIFNFGRPVGATGFGLGETVNPPTNSCNVSQLNNGALDGATDLMRFGLMTFDNDTAQGTGASLSPVMCANTPKGIFDGMWSYYPDWDGLGPPPVAPMTGWPSACTTTPFELGARNAAAPPWEGRLVGFPNQSADTTATSANNDTIQLVINAMRPYGGTPTAGMLTDAEYYMWGDPSGPQVTDSFVQNGCRDEYIILLTDGAPNEDLRPQCGTNAHGSGGGKCPYDLPQNTAASLFTGSDPFTGSYATWSTGKSVTTYVIGFAVSQINAAGQEGGIAGCGQLAVAGSPLTLSSVCNTAGESAPVNPIDSPTQYTTNNLTSSQYQQYQSCCALQQIALAGSGGQTGAFFADTPADLNAAIGAVLGAISKKVATRTLPSFSTAASYAGGNGSEALFLASFNAAATPWSGDVTEEHLTCTASAGTFVINESSNPSQGDDFGANLATTGGTGGRNFLVYTPPPGNSTIATTSGLTIRPFVTQALTWTGAGDGLGTLGTVTGGAGAEVGNFGVSATPITPSLFPAVPVAGAAFNITGTSCQDPVNRNFLSASDCSLVALEFAMAQKALSTPSDPGFPANAWNNPASGSTITPRVNNPLGGVLHSTPAVSSPPSSLVRDDSYQAFVYDVSQFAAPTRDPVLYVATTDGLLHAFDTANPITKEGTSPPTLGASAGKANNELWAFIPPGVLPNLLSEYYDASSIILDGAPVVRDVVWDRFAGTPLPPSCPGTADQCWHTMLVAGFGAGGRGYYALDVTDPRPDFFKAQASTDFPSAAKGAAEQQGPHFQWQLASAQLPPGAGTTVQQELFGKQSGTPALANIQYDPTGTGNPHEVGVAILPGGIDGGPTGGTCQRALNRTPGNYPLGSDLSITTPFLSRVNVRQWAPNCFGNGSGVAGRSVTIVRVDTGEVLAVFARNPIDSVDVPGTAGLSGTAALTLSPNRLIYAPFDSPMTGTPTVYPAELGADAQRIFIGDADGTLWRIDVSSTNPAKWTASLFVDPYGPKTEGANGTCPGATCPQANDSQPIAVSPLVALDDVGDVTVEFATGDTTTYTSSYTLPGSTTGTTYPVTSYIFAAQEIPASNLATFPNGVQTQVNWYLKLTNGERVSGPMVVFNNILYFATFAPTLSGGTACGGGVPRIWGLDFTQVASNCPAPTPDNVAVCTGVGFGGIPRDFLINPSGVPGVYTSPPDATGASTAGTVIPGVTVTYSPACIGTGTEIPAVPLLTAAIGKPPSAGNPNGTPVGLGNLRSAANGGLPGTTLSNTARTRLDSWAAIVE